MFLCAFTFLTIANVPLLPTQYGRRHKRGRGIFDTVKSAATKGLAMSNKYGIAQKLKGMSDPRAKVAGQLLEMAGGGRRRRHRGRK